MLSSGRRAGALARMTCLTSARLPLSDATRRLSRTAVTCKNEADLQKVLEKLEQLSARLGRIETLQRTQDSFFKQAMSAYKFPETQLTITARLTPVDDEAEEPAAAHSEESADAHNKNRADLKEIGTAELASDSTKEASQECQSDPSSQTAKKVAWLPEKLAKDLEFMGTVPLAGFDLNNFDQFAPIVRRLVKTQPRMPSVTTILSESASEQSKLALKLWEKKMIAELGEVGFKKYKSGAEPALNYQK